MVAAIVLGGIALASFFAVKVGGGGGGGGDGAATPERVRLQGRVLDGSGQPLSGAVVREQLSGRQARTGSAGRFKLVVPGGRRELVASRSGYLGDEQTLTADRPANVELSLWRLAGEAPPSANSADRIIFWSDCDKFAKQSDAQFRRLAQQGMGGFVCMVGRLRGMGGTQDFSPTERAPKGANYALQREIVSSRLVQRARRLGVRAYLGFYASNQLNKSTPFADWFDDGAWNGTVLPRVRDLSGAARKLGFAGLAIDQELYDSQTATWSWIYPGSDHSEAEVRDAARRRGSELMGAMEGAFPGVELVAYGTQLPGTWEAHVQTQLNHIKDTFAGTVQIDMWNGITSVPGYRAIRWLDASFYKSTQIPGASWDDALRYDARSVYSLLSRRLSAWSYAAPRLQLSPFAWIDSGPSEFERARAPAYVADQLAAFRRWGTDRMFGDYMYAGPNGFDLRPYSSALADASTPGTVDSVPPRMKVPSSKGLRARGGRVDLTGTATDGLAVRWIGWRDDHGRSGTAQLVPDIGSRDGAAVRWHVSGVPVPAGGSRIWLRAEDIKGLSTLKSIRVAG